MDKSSIEEMKDKFQFSSLEYVDELDGFMAAKDDADVVVLTGYNREAGCIEIHWAANSPEDVISGIPAGIGECLITFIPKIWVPTFERHGFAVRSIWKDYWKASLDDVTETSVYEFLSQDEAEAASAVTMACRGQSRGFTGQTPSWIASWLDEGSESNLASNIKNNAILVKRNEKREILGLVCTGVYGYDSERGPVAWIRETAVHPDHQRKGIARQLLLQALAYGKSYGAVRSFLAADECNHHAIRLYESVGFKAREDDGQIDMFRC